jgi:hypothetical protein
MTALEEMPLGQDGNEYLRDYLTRWSPFSEALAKQVEAGGGRIFATLPAGSTMERALQFDAGAHVNQRYMLDWMGDRAMAMCRARPGGVFVVEDRTARTIDPVFDGQTGTGLFAHHRHLFYFVECPDIDRRSIDRAYHACASFFFLGLFAYLPSLPLRIGADYEVDDGLIRELAAATVEIYASAYDQEGLVVWTRA